MRTGSATSTTSATGAVDAVGPRWRSPLLPARRSVARRWTDLVALVMAIAALGLSAVPVHADRVPALERTVFGWVNGTVTVPFVLVWPIMQLGNIVVVPVAAVTSLALRRFRLAGSITIGGGLVYALAKVVKRAVVRGRPGALLPDVHIHGTAAQGLGYVSGHAGVVALLAVVVFPYLGRRWRVAACVLASLVCLARLYVGAHLPLDVIGGAALGLAVGSAMHLLFGRPLPCS